MTLKRRQATKTLLLACSAKKNRYLVRAPASCLYTGTLFRLGMKWAEQNGYNVLILSAKYGWVQPEQIIDTYDQKLTTPFIGPWPETGGFYLGGRMYFSQAPARFQPLTPGDKIGIMAKRVKQLVSASQKSIFHEPKDHTTSG